MDVGDVAAADFGPAPSIDAEDNEPPAMTTTQRLVDHVERIGAEHPPIDLDTVDYTVRDPALVRERFGHVLDYMARVELEVDRNVLELGAMMPNPPEVDLRFYRDVWRDQEVAHGQVLDRLQQVIGRPPAVTDTETVSVRLRLLGVLAQVTPVQDMVRMLYYLTGMATERSAVIAYNRLHSGLLAAGEVAIAETAIAPIRRQEPPHYAFYKLSARGLAPTLSGWQKWLVRRLRAATFAPVGANSTSQRADFGAVLVTLGFAEDVDTFADEISRVEHDLLRARWAGLTVPTYVVDALRDAVALHRARDGRA